MHPGSTANTYLLFRVREASEVGSARGGITCTAADGRGMGHVGRVKQPGLKPA